MLNKLNTKRNNMDEYKINNDINIKYENSFYKDKGIFKNIEVIDFPKYNELAKEIYLE